MKLFSFILGPEKEKFRKRKRRGNVGSGRQTGRPERRSRERQRNKYTNLDPKAWGRPQRPRPRFRESEISTEGGPQGARKMEA